MRGLGRGKKEVGSSEGKEGGDSSVGCVICPSAKEAIYVGGGMNQSVGEL